jgi:hypothetical protein
MLLGEGSHQGPDVMSPKAKAGVEANPTDEFAVFGDRIL